MEYPLLSIPQLTKNGNDILMTGGKVLVIDRKKEELVLDGTMNPNRGLYLVPLYHYGEETPLKNLIATDLPGRYLVTSRRGNKYMFVLHDYDSNLIIAEPIESRNASDLVNGFDTCYKALTKNGFRAKKIRLDNKISKDFIQYLNKENLTYQLASPGDHRVNPAERSIQTYKNHFIAMLSGTDPSYPTNCWDLLIPQANITLNLLRESCIQPQLSAYAQIYGQFDYNKTPLAPAGCKILIHDRANERPSWANHGTDGFYIGPALQH
jgi:hypothetical protein